MSTNPEMSSFPPVDARLIDPESGTEVVRGEVVVTAAKFAHARPQARLVALLEAYVADDWVVASELTSRVAEHSDFAPDASIRPRISDPEQHDRMIDEVAFEVVNTQRRSIAVHKAEDMVARGVRRVFVIDVPKTQVLEWTPAGPVELSGPIHDPTLNSPLPVDVLLGFGSVKDEIAGALLQAPPPVLQAALVARLEAGREAGMDSGIEAGKNQVVQHMREQVLRRLQERGLAVSDAVAAGLEAPASIDDWMARLVQAESVPRAEDLLG